MPTRTPDIPALNMPASGLGTATNEGYYDKWAVVSGIAGGCVLRIVGNKADGDYENVGLEDITADGWYEIPQPCDNVKVNRTTAGTGTLATVFADVGLVDVLFTGDDAGCVMYVNGSAIGANGTAATMLDIVKWIIGMRVDGSFHTTGCKYGDVWIGNAKLVAGDATALHAYRLAVYG